MSVVQFRFWAPRKALQSRDLEATGSWTLARLLGLGPHRGLKGRAVRWHRGARDERQPTDDERSEASAWPAVFWWSGVGEEGAVGVVDINPSEGVS